MAFDNFGDWLSNLGTPPNQLTRTMGKLIRQAREESGLSQANLAEKIHRSQATLSQIESGKIRADFETVISLAYALNKPFRYFVPEEIMPRLEGEQSILEAELLAQASQLSEDDLERLIATARAFLETKRSREQKTE